MQKNDEITLRITGMTAEGAGVGRAEGMAVFVPFAAPEDLLRAHVVKVQKTYAFAKIERYWNPLTTGWNRTVRCSAGAAAASTGI